jgi:hypothetical protein
MYNVDHKFDIPIFNYTAYEIGGIIAWQERHTKIQVGDHNDILS